MFVHKQGWFIVVERIYGDMPRPVPQWQGPRLHRSGWANWTDIQRVWYKSRWIHRSQRISILLEPLDQNGKQLNWLCFVLFFSFVVFAIGETLCAILKLSIDQLSNESSNWATVQLFNFTSAINKNLIFFPIRSCGLWVLFWWLTFKMISSAVR